MIHKKLLILLGIFCFAQLSHGQGLSLSETLGTAFRQNSELAAAKAMVQAEESSVRAAWSLDNPKVGLMHENKMSLMQQQMGPMTSLAVSQEIKFPTKYFLRAGAQRAEANAASAAFRDRQLSLRSRVVTAFFDLGTSVKIRSLLSAQRETLKELARVVEGRRATGAVPQQDEMKVHVEQTRLEKEILLQEAMVVERQAMMEELSGGSNSQSLLEEDLRPPKLTADLKNLSSLSLEDVPRLSSRNFARARAEKEKSLAMQELLPDFMLSFRKPVSNSPPGAYAVGIELSIPLWFPFKQSSEIASASAKLSQTEKEYEMERRNILAGVKTGVAKVNASYDLLKLYETALIPQATSTLNSSRSAYSAGKTGFLELLDSERSLYALRIEYLENLFKYVTATVELERTVGRQLSSLPFLEYGESK